MRAYIEVTDTLKDVIANNAKGRSPKDLLDLIPEFIKQLALINQFDSSYKSYNAVGFEEILIPGELGFLIAPSKVSVVDGLNARDLLDRREFEIMNNGGKLLVDQWSPQDFAKFTALFYNQLRLDNSNVKRVSELRKEVIINSENMSKFGVVCADGEWCNYELTAFPYFLDTELMVSSFYNDSKDEVRDRYLRIVVSKELGVK